MAHVYRVVGWLWLALWISVPAHAEYLTDASFTIGIGSGCGHSIPAGTGSSAQAACNSACTNILSVQQYCQYPSASCTGTLVSGGTWCQWSGTDSRGTAWSGSGGISVTCAMGTYSAADGKCHSPATVCPVGYHVHVPDDGTCIADCSGDQIQKPDGTCGCVSGSSAGWVSYTKAAGAGAWPESTCSNGCTVNIGSFSVANIFNPSNWTGSSSTWYSRGTRSGATCATSTTIPGITVSMVPPQSMPPADTSGTNAGGTAPDPLNTQANGADPVACGQAGGAWGTVNGVAKCLTPGAANNGLNALTKLETAALTTVNPDGSSTVKQTDSVVQNDGTGSGQVSSTTKTTTKNAAGAETGSSTTTQSGTKAGFCQENPNSSVCKPTGGSFGGSCETGFSCDGDPVACATAKAAWEHRCQFKWAESSNPLSQSVTEAATTKGPDEDKALNKDGTHDFDLWASWQANQQTYLSFTKSCPASASFTFKGREYTFDFSAVCSLGTLLAGLMRLSAYMMVLRALMRFSTS